MSMVRGSPFFTKFTLENFHLCILFYCDQCSRQCENYQQTEFRELESLRSFKNRFGATQRDHHSSCVFYANQWTGSLIPMNLWAVECKCGIKIPKFNMADPTWCPKVSRKVRLRWKFFSDLGQNSQNHIKHLWLDIKNHIQNWFDSKWRFHNLFIQMVLHIFFMNLLESAILGLQFGIH